MPLVREWMPYYTSNTSTGGWYDLGTFSNNITTVNNTDDTTWSTWPTGVTTAAGTWSLTYNRVSDIRRAEQDIEAVADEAFARQHSARRQAIDRAEELLLSLLTTEQRDAYRRDNMFLVIGSHGTVYRIRTGVAGNIEWLTPDGHLGGRLCAHPTMDDDWLPTADVMISQVLALTTDERAFLQLANVHAGRLPQLAAA